MESNRDITEFSNHLQTREQVLEKFVALLISKEFLRKKLQDLFNKLGILNSWP